MRIITDYSLKKASEHIFYEVWMFYQIVLILKTTTDQLQKNILLESFAIHARNLFDFFYPKKHSKDDDILVNDYIKSINNYKRKRTKRKQLYYLIRKTDKQVAHLTYTRNRYNRKTKGWKFKDIGDQLKNSIIVFYDSLPKKMLRWENFKRLKNIIDQFPNI